MNEKIKIQLINFSLVIYANCTKELKQLKNLFSEEIKLNFTFLLFNRNAINMNIINTISKSASAPKIITTVNKNSNRATANNGEGITSQYNDLNFITVQWIREEVNQ